MSEETKAIDSNEILVMAIELLKSGRPSDKAVAGELKRFAAELSRTMAVVEAAREWSKALENQNDIAALDNAENALIRAVDALKEG